MHGRKAEEDGDQPAYRPRALLKSNTQRAIRGEDKYVQRQLEAQRRREQKKQALENLGKPRSVARAVLQPRAAQPRHQDSTETHAQDFSQAGKIASKPAPNHLKKTAKKPLSPTTRENVDEDAELFDIELNIGPQQDSGTADSAQKNTITFTMRRGENYKTRVKQICE